MLVTYDVNTSDPAGRRRLRRVARACLDWGQRVQYSVFECELDPAQWVLLRARLLDEIDPETDSLRFYRLGADGLRRISEAATRVLIARRFFNDAVRDTRTLRARRMPRLLRLAGHRELPQFFDIDDTSLFAEQAGPDALGARRRLEQQTTRNASSYMERHRMIPVAEPVPARRR